MHKPHSLVVVLLCLFLSTYFLVACRREPNLLPTNPSQSDTTQTNTDTTHLPSDSTLQPHDTTVQAVDTSSYSVDNTWECDIDGIHYSGTVDTSFMQLTGIFPDTMVTCTGTSDDRKANIHFVMKLNRNTQPEGTYTNFDGMFGFDATPEHSVIANWNMSEKIHFIVDTLVSNKLRATFNGTASGSYNPVSGFTHTVSNGHFSCTFGKGNNEPKFFSFHSSSEGDVAGVFRKARLESNSLVLDGVRFGDYEQKFKLTIRTGGTIKPGIYEGKNGDVGMSLFIPGLYRHYITDAPGNTIVVISSVLGNDVRGTFSAVDEQGKTIQQGKFSCRVKDYTPEADLTDQWQFTTNEGPEGIFGFRAFGGNIRSAALTQDGSKYSLTINGESDHGASVFKVVLHADKPIDTGVYKTDYMPSYSTLDELYFRSPVKIWNGNDTYLYADNRYTAYCKITAIDQSHVEGILYGTIIIFLNEGSLSSAPIQYGKFRASF